MGVIAGYQDLPQAVKTELAPYMTRNYHFTSLSIESASDLSYDLALENISQNGGTISDEDIDIDTQEYEFDGPYEVSFTDLAFADIFTRTEVPW